MKKTLLIVFDYLKLLIGCFVMVAAYSLFLVPYKIAPGGVTGLATVIYYMTGNKVPIGITTLIINIPLFVFGFNRIGKGFFARSLFGMVSFSFLIDITDGFFQEISKKYLATNIFSGNTDDILLYSIFGGVLMGVGLGLIIKTGATTGGTDLGAYLLKSVISWLPMGQLLMLIDATVIVIAAYFFKSFKLGLYALITMFVAAKTIDAIIEGADINKGIYIISEKSREIADVILKDLDRGVTGLYSKGMYSNVDKTVLFCIVKRNEVPFIKKMVKEVDQKAFVILHDVGEVYGEGFKPVHKGMI